MRWLKLKRQNFGTKHKFYNFFLTLRTAPHQANDNPMADDGLIVAGRTENHEDVTSVVVKLVDEWWIDPLMQK